MPFRVSVWIITILRLKQEQIMKGFENRKRSNLFCLVIYQIFSETEENKLLTPGREEVKVNVRKRKKEHIWLKLVDSCFFYWFVFGVSQPIYIKIFFILNTNIQLQFSFL